MRFPISLKKFFSLQFIIVSAFPLIITGLLILIFLLPVIKENISIKHHTLARTIAGHISSHLLGGERQLLSIAELFTNNHQFSEEQLNTILDSACGKGELFESIFIFDNKTQTISHVGLAKSRRTLRNDLIGLDISGRSFQQSTENNRATWSRTLLSTLSNRMAVAVRVTLADRSIVGEITLDNLSEFISHLPTKTDLHTIILDQSGRIVADSRRVDMGRKLEFESLPVPVNTNTPISESYFLDDEKLIGAMVTVDQVGWNVLVSQPYLSAFSPVRIVIGIVGGGFFLALATALTLGMRQASWFSKLSNRYVNQAKSIAQGEYNIHLPPSKILEYNELAISLKSMVTQIKEREESLRITKFIFDQASIAIFRIGENGEILDANEQACTNLGYSKEELCTLTIFDIDPLFTKEKWFKHREKTKTTSSLTLETSHRKKSGESFPVEILICIMFYNDQEFRVSFVQDITEKKKVKREQAKLQVQLEQAQKLESIGRLAGGIAHDLNNLLTPILGYTELLSLDPQIDDNVKRKLSHIDRAATGAKDLIKQLLAFSRKQVLEKQPVNLNSIIDSYENLIRRTIRENIKIKISKSEEIQPVMADPGQIGQVMMNLVVNASDAMPEGGTLTIKSKMTELDDYYAANHPEVVPGDYVLLAISDTGSGMDEETITKIFEPFYSTKEDLGTGLGLAMVYGIVKQHQGSIWVYSEPGKGTTFKVYLPVTDQIPADIAIKQKVFSNIGGNETILLVEDNEKVRTAVYDILLEHGYRVLKAADGKSALEAISPDTKIDLLLTDVVMPDMNGRELYSLVSKTIPAVKVLYMSGYTDDIIVHHGVLDEGVRFIQKPFSSLAISQRVREVLDS